MPAPIVPPFPTDTGALTQPRTLWRWLDVNRVTKLDRTQGYFNIPATQTNNTIFAQASDICVGINYEASNNFSIKNSTELMTKLAAVYKKLGLTYSGNQISVSSNVASFGMYQAIIPVGSGVTVSGSSIAALNGYKVVTSSAPSFFAYAVTGVSDGTYADTLSATLVPTVGFMICISYRVGTTVTRYKLYSNPDFNYSINPDMYNNQMILKNFRIEIWNSIFGTDINYGAHIVLNGVNNIITSLLGKVDYRYGNNFSMVTPDAPTTDFLAANDLIGNIYIPMMFPSTAVSTTN